MAKGENIFKRRDGRWEARYIKDRDADGKALYGYCYGKTYKDAKEKVMKRRAELLLGISPEPRKEQSPHTFGHYCDAWLTAGKDRLRVSTLNKYETILTKHIKPEFGGCRLQSISQKTVDAFARKLRSEKKLSEKTVKDILVVFRSVLSYAANAEREPAPGPYIRIELPKCAKKEIRVLSREEQTVFISYLLKDMDACKFGILLTMHTGVRIGEICALQWKDISLKDRIIRVSSSIQRQKSQAPEEGRKTKVVSGPPKSETSVRTIPLSPYAIRLCEAMYQKDPEAYILTGTRKCMEPRTLQYRIKRYTEDCQLKDVHCHTFRHTFATRCVEVDFEVKSLSEILGHASTTITMERYVHPTLELKRQNMDKLAAVGL